MFLRLISLNPEGEVMFRSGFFHFPGGGESQKSSGCFFGGPQTELIPVINWPQKDDIFKILIREFLGPDSKLKGDGFAENLAFQLMEWNGLHPLEEAGAPGRICHCEKASSVSRHMRINGMKPSWFTQPRMGRSMDCLRQRRRPWKDRWNSAKWNTLRTFPKGPDLQNAMKTVAATKKGKRTQCTSFECCTTIS